MQAYEIIKKIEAYAPAELACSWDNSGFLCGDKNRNIKKVFLTLDVNLTTVHEAINAGADMIVSHHPIYFSGLKKIDFSNPESKMTELLIKNNIAVFAAHTNMDAAENGINQKLAEIFELSQIQVLEPINEKTGIGRFGLLNEEMSANSFCEIVKKKLSTHFVRLAGNGIIKKLAICSGSGGEYWRLAKKNGCNALLTGDVKYHTALEATENGIIIIDAGHFPTEHIVCEIFEKALYDLPIKLIKSQNKDIFEIK